MNWERIVDIGEDLEKEVFYRSNIAGFNVEIRPVLSIELYLDNKYDHLSREEIYDKANSFDVYVNKQSGYGKFHYKNDTLENVKKTLIKKTLAPYIKMLRERIAEYDALVIHEEEK